VSEKGEAMNEQPDKVGEQPVSHRENTWTICARCFSVLAENDEGACACHLRGEEPRHVPVVSSEWRERAERAEAEAVRLRHELDPTGEGREIQGEHLTEWAEAGIPTRCCFWCSLNDVNAAFATTRAERDEARALALELAEAVERHAPSYWRRADEIIARVRALADNERRTDG
jgi:hypothetical protein